MSANVASELLRPGLLEGVSILHAGADGTPASAGDSGGALVCAACAELGAGVWTLEEACAGPLGAEEATTDEAVQRILAESGGIDLLVLDAGALFAAGAIPGGQDPAARTALRSCLEQAWNVTRAVANLAFLPSGRGAPASRTWRARCRSSGPGMRSPPSRSRPAPPPRQASWPP